MFEIWLTSKNKLDLQIISRYGNFQTPWKPVKGRESARLGEKGTVSEESERFTSGEQRV